MRTPEEIERCAEEGVEVAETMPALITADDSGGQPKPPTPPPGPPQNEPPLREKPKPK